MADFPNNANVIHGEGKPVFWIPTESIWNGTNSASSATTITLNAAAGVLDGLNNEWVLANFIVWSLNTETPAEETFGRITSYVDATGVLTVSSWNNGTPDTSVATRIQSKSIYLPYCQRLTEIFTPDFIVKKMLDGSIRRNKRGFYYSASLDYARYFHKDEMLLIRDLFNTKYEVFRFFPRIDNTGLFYEVDISPDTEMAFYQLKHHQGHGGVVINLTGIARVDKIPFFDLAVDVTKVETDDTGLYETDDSGIYETEGS